MNIKQLEINVNLHCLKPDFLNYELHYVIASDENHYRFAAWDELPNSDEQKFYCFRMEKTLYIPAGNITLNPSYVLKEKPVYPLLTSFEDFVPVIESLGSSGVAKCIKRFTSESIDAIKNSLE